jgi:hypothetical protein
MMTVIVVLTVMILMMTVIVVFDCDDTYDDSNCGFDCDDTYDDSNCGYDCDDKSITVLAVSLIITLYQIHEINIMIP